MRLDTVIASSIPNVSYVQAQKLIDTGCVRIGTRLAKCHWQLLRSGHYFIKIKGLGVYKFAIRKNSVKDFKEVKG